MKKIAVIGAGAFGTSLACSLGRGGADVWLWGRKTSHFNENRINETYLPGVEIPKSVQISDALFDLKGSDIVLLVTPAQQIQNILSDLKGQIQCDALVLCSKGIEANTGLLQTEIATEFYEEHKLAVLSGPSFALDIGQGKPTALTLAAFDVGLGQSLQQDLSTDALRLYLSDDPKGVQLGGALKNVIAIAAGMVDGANLGESARAALITRGFSEMKAVAVKLGAKTDTLNGLSGLGDLTLTCSSDKSRNYRFGKDVALRGAHTPTDTVEGIATAKAAFDLAKSNNIETPIVDAVQNVLQGNMTVTAALTSLMTRPLRRE